MAQDRGLDSNAVNFARANGYWGWCIPEFDDDQRLSDGIGGNEYGPVAHVLAAPWLDTLSFDGNFRQVAIIEVDLDTRPTPAPYTDMRLKQFNCLYLRKTSSLPRFDAEIAPADSPSLQCPTTVTANHGGPPLVVVVDDAFDSPHIEDFPATTRFIEGRNGRTLIGVRCGNFWCAVGPPNAVEPTGAGRRLAASAHDGQPGYNNAAARVKGWFDDQVLGVPDNNPSYKIHRQVRASAVPNPNLASLTVNQFKVATGVETYRPVGRVFFATAPDTASKYVKVFGFSQGTNDIALRAEINPSPTIPGKQDTVWFTQVVNAQGTRTNDILTRRMDHRAYLSTVFGEKFKIPGTMRWRWSDGDEDLWIECDVGCCLAGIH